MIALYILLGIIIFFLLLMLIPVSVKIGYDGNKFFLYLKILFIKFDLLKKTDYLSLDKATQEEKPKTEKTAKASAEKADKTDGEEAKISDVFRQLKETVLVFIKKSARHLHVKLEDFDLTIATEDAAKTAILTGAVSGAVIFFFTFLEENTNFSAKKELYLGVKPDFLAEKTKFRVSLKISALLVELLAILLPSYMAFVKNKPNKKNNKK